MFYAFQKGKKNFFKGSYLKYSFLEIQEFGFNLFLQLKKYSISLITCYCCCLPVTNQQTRSKILLKHGILGNFYALNVKFIHFDNFLYFYTWIAYFCAFCKVSRKLLFFSPLVMNYFLTAFNNDYSRPIALLNFKAS